MGVIGARSAYYPPAAEEAVGDWVGKEHSNSHGAMPVHLTITMAKWFRVGGYAAAVDRLEVANLNAECLRAAHPLATTHTLLRSLGFRV